MPPKRANSNESLESIGAKRAKGKQADTAPTIGTLLARCSRSDLERLLEESVISGQACTYAKVQSALPEAKQALLIARPKVASGQTREGTGYFDMLDDELLLAIFSQVSSTKTRLSSAIAVCKAWRGVLKCTEVFNTLDLDASFYSYISVCPNRLPLSPSHFPRLLEWLPKVSAVTSLKLNMGDKRQSIPPDVAKKALPRFTGLTHLEIAGKKATPALFAVLAKQPYVANLTSFSIGHCSAKPEDAVKLLVNATRLLSLKVGFGGDAARFLNSLANGWRAKRGGDATPLLTSLELAGSLFSGRLALDSFTSLANLFPELTMLRTGLFCHSVPSVMADEHFSGLMPMARLRELTVSSLIAGPHLTSDQLYNVLRTICQVAPNLTKLALSHGTMYVSSSVQRVDPYPSPNGALGFLPVTLESLELGTMTLTPSDFEAATLGALRSLTLNRCGPHAEGLAVGLCVSCPFLELKRCFVSEPQPSGRYGSYRLICLDSEEEAKRKEAEAAAQASSSKVIQGSAAGTSASGAANSPTPDDDEGSEPMDEVNTADDESTD